MAAGDTRAKLWPGGIVPYKFDAGYPCAADMKAAMAQIEAKTRLRFCEQTIEANFVSIGLPPSGSRSYSEVIGMKAGPQDLLVDKGFKCLHELGHAIGLIHEQQRGDASTYITLDTGMISYQDPINKRGSDFDPYSMWQYLGPYDRFSVMHYPAPCDAGGWGSISGTGEVWTMHWNADTNQKLGAGPNQGWENLTATDADGIVALYKGAGWSEIGTVPGATTSATPGLAEFSSELCAVWKGNGNGNIVGGNKAMDWSKQTTFHDVGTSASPSLANYQGGLMMAWKGVGTETTIFFASGTPYYYGKQDTLPKASTSHGPSLAYFDPSTTATGLYCAWKESADESMSWAKYDGTKWTIPQSIVNTGTTTGPALAEYNGRLYAAWKGITGDYGIYTKYFDGAWDSKQYPVGDKSIVSSNHRPALAKYDGELYLVYVSQDNKSIMCVTSTDGKTWTGAVKVQSVTTDSAPILVYYKALDCLVCAWRDSSTGNIRYSTFRK